MLRASVIVFPGSNCDRDIKVALEAELQARQEAIAQAELEAMRRAGSVDVTLPGRPQNIGKLHITTRTLRDIYPYQMQLNPAVKNIHDFRFEDFTLANYDPHPAIKAPIAV